MVSFTSDVVYEGAVYRSALVMLYRQAGDVAVMAVYEHGNGEDALLSFNMPVGDFSEATIRAAFDACPYAYSE